VSSTNYSFVYMRSRFPPQVAGHPSRSTFRCPNRRSIITY